MSSLIDHQKRCHRKFHTLLNELMEIYPELRVALEGTGYSHQLEEMTPAAMFTFVNSSIGEVVLGHVEEIMLRSVTDSESLTHFEEDQKRIAELKALFGM